MVESLLFIGAGVGVGAGADEKNARSRPKTDWLHNTAIKRKQDFRTKYRYLHQLALTLLT